MQNDECRLRNESTALLSFCNLQSAFRNAVKVRFDDLSVDFMLAVTCVGRYASVMSEITRIRNHAERAVPDRGPEFLTAGMVAHVGIVQDGQPFVIPMNYAYDAAEPHLLYLHGGQASRLQKVLAAGAPVCIEVTTVDGLVYSRSALYHSTNYRSVVCFGTAHAITDSAKKNAVFTKMIDRYFPGRTAGRDYSSPSQAELDATAMVEVRIREMSAKTRVGPPKGPNDEAPTALGNCGVEDLVVTRKKIPHGE